MFPINITFHRVNIFLYPQFLIDAHAITIFVKCVVEKMEERKVEGADNGWGRCATSEAGKITISELNSPDLVHTFCRYAFCIYKAYAQKSRSQELNCMGDILCPTPTLENFWETYTSPTNWHPWVLQG